MKKIFLLSSILFLQACGTAIPLKGNRQIQNSFTTSTPKEQVWASLIAIIAEKGIGIKTIDKQSGLLICERSKMGYTFENQNGNPEDTTAPLVIQKYELPQGSWSKPVYNVTAAWNIVITELEGKTKVTINVVNIEATSLTGTGSFGSVSSSDRPVALDGYSTGVFEKTVFDKLKI